MWQWAPHSSLDQSLPNRSPIPRRDSIEGTNISPWDPLLWWGNGERRQIKGKGRERDREREKEREKERERMGGFGGETRSLRRAGFKSSLSPVSSWLRGQWFLSSSRSFGLVQNTASQTLMIWQLRRGGEVVFNSVMPLCIFIATSIYQGSPRNPRGTIIYFTSDLFHFISTFHRPKRLDCAFLYNNMTMAFSWSSHIFRKSVKFKSFHKTALTSEAYHLHFIFTI